MSTGRARRPEWSARLLACAAVAGLAACATTPQADNANDPLEPMNRYFFEVNRFFDAVALKPVTEIYVGITPNVVRRSVTNVLDNLDAPVSAVDALLQGDVTQAGTTAARFVVNSTAGVGGLFDVAEEIGLQQRDEDFGQTLGVWGVGEGPYLMLPLLGPAPPRDLAGRVFDYAIDPWSYAWSALDITPAGYVRTGMDIIDGRAKLLGTLDDIERSSVDYYAAVRNLYRQRRNAEISNGETANEDLPTIE